jgi:hypothetical protein
LKPFVATSSRLGILPGLRWTVDWRWAVFMPALISLIVPFLMGLALEWRVINPLQQYKGVIPGDVFLSIAGGIAISLAIHHLDRPFYPKWYQLRWWHVTGLVFGAGFAAFFWYGEIQNTIHQYWPDAAYTVAQLVGPTHLYHTVIVVLFGYLFFAVIIPVMIHVPRQFWLSKVMILLLIAGWVFCFAYWDNNHPRPDLDEVHGEWFGGHWRDALDWLRGLFYPLFDQG